MKSHMLTRERLSLLRLRTEIREHNIEHPRCAGCGCSMLVFKASDIVTPEHMANPGYSYLRDADYRPGDLVCIWCIYDEIGQPEQPYIWGHA